MENLICGLAPNTRRNYKERYIQNIQPVIGTMPLSDVKPMHCKVILNCMEVEYAGSTIRQTYITMGTMFRAVNDIHFLTVEEQNKFLEAARRSHNYRQVTAQFH